MVVIFQIHCITFNTFVAQSTTGSERVALILTFQLPAGSYATMVVREMTRRDMSRAHQTTLNVNGVDHVEQEEEDGKDVDECDDEEENCGVSEDGDGGDDIGDACCSRISVLRVFCGDIY
jgi:hypothetical protein